LNYFYRRNDIRTEIDEATGISYRILEKFFAFPFEQLDLYARHGKDREAPWGMNYNEILWVVKKWVFF
jgi:hypothetical protein